MNHSHTFQSKGLSNPKGANNCWLNSAVQLLWHIDVFRESLQSISGHYRCLQEYCVYCHVKALLSDYAYNQELSIPPDALRNALATSCSKSFKMGNLGDPIEAYQAVLDRLHEQLVQDEPDGQCSAVHCVVHRKFSLNIVEMYECDNKSCNYTTNPDSSWQLSRWMSARDVIANPRHINDVLSPKNEFLPCDQKLCKGKLHQRKILLNSPEIFTLCVGWDSVHSSPQEIQTFLEALPTKIHLNDIFNTVLAPQDPLMLAGVVCYYGMHYSLFLKHSAKNVWIYLDDSIVKQIASEWDEVKDKVIRAHQQPCMVVYVSQKSTPISINTAPKNVTVDFEKLKKLQEKLQHEIVTNEQADHLNSQRLLEEEDRKYAQQLEEEERAIEETRRQEELFRQQQETERLRKLEEEERTQQLRNEQEAIFLQIQKDNQRKLEAQEAQRQRQEDIERAEEKLEKLRREKEEIENTKRAFEENERAERRRADAQRNANRISEAERRRYESERRQESERRRHELEIKSRDERSKLEKRNELLKIADQTLSMNHTNVEPTVDDLINVADQSDSFSSSRDTGKRMHHNSGNSNSITSLSSRNYDSNSTTLSNPVRHSNISRDHNDDFVNAARQQISAVSHDLKHSTGMTSQKTYDKDKYDVTERKVRKEKRTPNYERSTHSSRVKEKPDGHSRQGSRDSGSDRSEKERKKRSELNRANTISKDKGYKSISSVKTGGFTNMVKGPPLMDRLKSTSKPTQSSVGSGYMSEMMSRSDEPKLIRVEKLEQSRTYASHQSYPSTRTYTADYNPVEIPPSGRNQMEFERTSSPEEIQAQFDPIRPSTRAHKNSHDLEQEQMNRSAQRNSKRWRTPAKSREYMSREDPLYPIGSMSGSTSVDSNTTGSMSPPCTYPFQPDTSKYDYTPTGQSDRNLIDMEGSGDSTGMHNVKQAVNSVYGKTSSGFGKMTKNMNKGVTNLTRNMSNLISSNRKKNDTPIIHSQTAANLQSNQQSQLPLNLASSDSRRKKY